MMGLPKPIPILLTVRELNYGGIERDVTKIALGIDRSRFEPHVASYQAKGMRFEELKRAGIPFLHVPFFSLKSPTALPAAMRVRRYIKENGICLVHAYDSSAVFLAPIARALRVPAVLSSVLGSRGLVDGRTLRQLRWTDKIVDTVVVNCEAMRRHMIDDEHVESERIQLCYNGVDTTQFYPAEGRKPAPVEDASFVIGTVCVLRAEKALELLQDAFARVRHLKPGMKLLIVGSGPELPRLEVNSRRLGLTDDCLFVPATPSVPQFLRALGIFVSCSTSEAFSNTILEAMACGCCVIGSRVGGTPELIGNDERGLLFRAGDAGDLAAKLRTLIENESLRRELGSRAAKFATEKLNIGSAASRMMEIYENVLFRKSCRGLFPITRKSFVQASKRELTALVNGDEKLHADTSDTETSWRGIKV
jgi:glycosyltransferase involved in cell wall biosynthesis